MGRRRVLVAVGLAIALAVVVLAAGCSPTLMPQMSYQGRLTDAGGNPVTGTRSMVFKLYNASTGGAAVWQETQPSVQVTNGLFDVALGSVTPLDARLFHERLWIEVTVAGQVLSPRQQLLGSPYAFSLVPGSLVRGAIAANATNTYTSTLSVLNTSTGQALVANSALGIGAYIEGGGQGRFNAALRVYNSNTSQGMAGYIVNKSNYATAHISNEGSGEVLWLTNGGTDAAGAGGNDFIQARNKPENDVQFRVTTGGEVYADGTYHASGADLAEMLPAADGLEAGDVLAIGSDGKLTRSSAAYQTTVVGIYSTQPGFVGGEPADQELEGHVPLAIVGIVPVKVCAENGAIVPGDLLTSSSTPGVAMKATEARPGTILGKALQELTSGTGVIHVLVTLR